MLKKTELEPHMTIHLDGLYDIIVELEEKLEYKDRYKA
jgi:hypothetical protein